jgi:DNA primase catalytic core
MTLHKLTAGDGYTYLTRQVAASDATNRGYSDLGAYYSEKGEAPGVWMGTGLSSVPDFPLGEHVTEAQMKALFGEGRHPNADAIERAAIAAGKDADAVDRASRLGNPYRIHEQANMFHRRSAGAFRDYNTEQGRHADTPVPAEVRAQIRSDIAAKMFTETYGRDPVDARELSGHLARISRQATTAVAGYDLSFSPVKSVSTLWAVAPREVAATIEHAHHEAVKDTITWLEKNATYTRRGKGGVAQVEVHGLIAAAFTHRDSRAGDPDLHTHVAVSNKVQAKNDGQWLALDGRPFFKNNVAASERYNTRLEALLIERLGVSFADRAGTDPSKRPIREIVGVDGVLPRHWSKRRASIDVRRAALSAQFQTDHGRPPTPNEACELAQKANTDTRQRKHEPRSYADQRATWRSEALGVLGGDVGLRDYVQRALHAPGRRQPPQRVTTRWVHETAHEVLTTVQSSRAVWQENHVRAEAERRVRAAGVRLGDVDRAVDALVARALSPTMSLPLSSAEPVTEPAALRRSDGTSVYIVAGSKLYTSREIVAAEQAIVAAAARKDGRLVGADTIDIALLESTANGVELNPGQVQLVRQLATSGARVQLALAPAGTGKTTAMRVLSRAWASPGPDGSAGGTVVGLAPSAAAAAVLREEIGTSTDTLAKLIHSLETGIAVPEWVTAIGPNTLVVIDEAGMAGTADLAKAIQYVVDRGGSVRLIGDDQQLAAIGAGGVLRDISEVHGAVTLSQVMRFTDPITGAPNHAEGAASLALRDGDSAATAYYIDNNRIHVGDLTTATDDAYTAWSDDRSKGRDSIMLAPTRDLVAELNDRARRDRLDTDPGPVGRQVTLADHSQASAGDAIITRQNNRKIPIGAHDWVKNGDRWVVENVRESGALDVIHHDTHRHITLPAAYVAEHVSLGYASTVHGAQGITADTCYTVATGEESRQLLYVAMTRGRHANHVHLTTAGDGDEHAVITRDALLPPTAVDILTRVLARDGAPVSAASQARSLADPATRLAASADRYYDALNTAAVDYLKREHGDAAMSRIDTAAEAALPGLTRHEAYPTLRAHLALCAVDGHAPADMLRRALSSDRGLADARDVAAVLDWRLDTTGRRSTATGRNSSPLSWLPPVPDALAADAEWGTYLHDRAEHVTAAAGDIAARAGNWTPTSAPGWALPIIDRDPALAADLAVWRAAHDVPDTDRRPTGPPLPAAADARAQRALDQRVTRLLGDPRAATARWTPLADGIDERIAADPYWPTLADRLTIAERAGIDITSLTHAVGGESPLPDEQPAAALWWRLSRHLSPAATTATEQSVSDTLRPDWTPVLADIVGAEAAHRVLADPAWPALVAAVTHARRDGWKADQLLTTAHDLLLGGQPEDEPLRPDELATALVWRIGMLTDTAATRDGYVPPEQVDEPPMDVDDLGALPDADAHFDDDWHGSLTEPVPGEHKPEPLGREDLTPARDGAAQCYVTDLEDDPIAAIHAALDARDEARDFARAAEEHFCATAAVPRDRLVELNRLAEDFFTDHYRDAWAPKYLSERLGTDLAGDARFSVGYAPARWTALTDHLRRHGATDEEIVGAGLGRVASTGRVIDQFRDRLVFPIKDTNTDGDPEILGWIGRRNPTKGDEDNAGPKYLNTAETDLFRKGNELYGLSEATSALADGAAVVLVEGPMDAIAVTLAGDGDFVGVAPLGTALTDTQADKLRPHIGAGKPDPIVATDADAAGQQAAYRAFWQLAARNANPQHLVVADGKDPAELLQTAGPEALHGALSAPTDLADAVIAARLSEYRDRLDTVEGRVFATRRAAEVIAALPDGWIERTDRLVAQTGISKQTAMSEVIDAVDAWTADPRGLAKKHLAERPPILPTPEPATADTSTRSLAADLPPAQRWAALADSVHAGLSNDPYWPALARTIDQAAASGIDVNSLLPGLLADNPLPDEHPARSLDFRLVDAAGDVTRPSTRRPEPISRGDDEAAAQTRNTADRATADRRRPTCATAPPAARTPVEPDRAPPPANPPPALGDPRPGPRR